MRSFHCTCAWSALSGEPVSVIFTVCGEAASTRMYASSWQQGSVVKTSFPSGSGAPQAARNASVLPYLARSQALNFACTRSRQYVGSVIGLSPWKELSLLISTMAMTGSSAYRSPV